MRVFRLGSAILVAALLLIARIAAAEDASLAAEWAKYRDRFVAEDGRVLDTGNRSVSHTEGQGWAMLFAESFDDRATFDRVWTWTRNRLQRKDSALFAWRWDPGNEQNPIADTNNASDGDILIAWALTRAWGRWHGPQYRDEARRIIADIRGKLIEKIDGRLVLIPGAEGFKTADGARIVNPSYYIYPAFAEFRHLDPSPEWSRLRRDGLVLLAKARFGRWGLPSDWVAVGARWQVTTETTLPPRFGFDAIRIPLYLMWGRAATNARLGAELAYWNGFTDKPIPAWVDVIDGSVAPFPAPTGFQAIIQLARWRHQSKAPPLPTIGDEDDYYSASLTLLAALAHQAAVR
ncbi:MAG TPA: glycosyl hydrolase family 8 [Stellaceae bacterium]|nr:glycosyl hydrolase family 8 [Stellaceae bacterium]